VAEITDETRKIVRTARPRLERVPWVVSIGKDAGECELGE
jgi:hypothetical protein